jgi:uncharacterized protein
LSEEDLQRAAAYVGMTPQEFESKYVIRYPTLLRLRRSRTKECHFLFEGGCSIHPAKPTQCRLYPFWPELVSNRKAWRQESKVCPGIGQGKLVQIGDACERADEMKRVYPSIYPTKIESA